MKIYVCGDSFCSTDAGAPGRHFSELIGATSLARGGVSNIDICFQIKEAIAQHADYVIIGTTDPGRIEIPLVNLTDENRILLENLRPGKKQKYISDTIPTFIGVEPDLATKYNLTPELRRAVQEYFKHMYDPNLKMEIDMWAIQHWLTTLENHNIRYFVLPKTFCIYEYAMKNPNEPWVFHTNELVQNQAARELETIIKP